MFSMTWWDLSAASWLVQPPVWLLVVWLVGAAVCVCLSG
jgi:hypothetical protein